MDEIWGDEDDNTPAGGQEDSEVPDDWESRLTDDIETEESDGDNVPKVIGDWGDTEILADWEADNELESLADEPVRNEAYQILPIMAFRRQILEKILSHRVTCIRGETGCGKSTMVPQFIMEDADSNPSKYPRPVSIVVTQPRRLAAQTLAQRVAQTRMEEVGETVGYKIGQDYCCSKDTKLIYVTTGHLLQSLVMNPESFRRYTHVILDEVHLRKMDSDLLSLMIKLLSDDIHGQVKIVVMSASIKGDMFPRYFDPDYDVEDSLFVGTKCFPVEMIYLEDLNHYFGNTLNVHQKLNILKAVGFYNRKPLNFYTDQSTESDSDEEDDDEEECTYEHSPLVFERVHDLLIEMRSKKYLNMNDLTKVPESLDPKIRNELCVAVVKACARAGESVLIFLPGQAEIEELFDMLIDCERPGKPGWRNPIRLFSLHSMIPFEDQMDALNPPPPVVAHVLLATDIAENSLTVPNVRIVIDFGIHKQSVYNSKRSVSILEKAWCSKASCEQRAGRAGRVFKGRCIRLYTRDCFEEFKDFNEPEIKTASLAECVLRVKHIEQHFSDYTPHELLQQTIEPPCTENFDEAVENLADMGAIKENDEQSDMTLLGVVALNLPTDMRLSRLVLYGVLFNCACDAIVMAAALQTKDPFTLPTKLIMKDDAKFRHSVEKSFHYRSLFDEGQYNEPLMYRNLMIEWLCFVARYLPSDDYPVTDCRRSRQQRMCFSVSEARADFCRRHAVIPKRFLVFENTVRRLASSTVEMIPKEHESRKKINTLIKLLPSDYTRRKETFPSLGAALLQEEWIVRNPSELFTQNTWVIDAVLCAAFNPAIMKGDTVKRFKTKQGTILDLVVKMEEGMQRSGVDPRRSVLLGVPEDLMKNPKVLRDVIKSICNPVKIRPYNKSYIAVEFREDRTDSAYPRPVINNIPLEVHALHLFTERREIFPVQLSAADAACIGVEDSSHISLTTPIQPYLIKWSIMSWGGKPLKQSEIVPQALCRWRNPIGFACDTEKCTHYGMTYRFAACGRLTSGLAEGVSVLPSENDNLKAIALLLTFQPAQFGVSFKVSGQERRILSAEMFQYNLKFSRKSPLTPRLLQSINELRAKISHAFNDEKPDSRSFYPKEVIPEVNLLSNLKKLLKEASVPSGAVQVIRDGRSRENNSWRSSKYHQGEPVKTPDVTSVITGNSVEDKPDLIFRVDAFEKQPEKCGTSDFTLLKPYDVQALEHVFVRAKQILSNCNESQVSDDDDDDDDNADNRSEHLSIEIENELTAEVTKLVTKSSGSVRLVTLISNRNIKKLLLEIRKAAAFNFVDFLQGCKKFKVKRGSVDELCDTVITLASKESPSQDPKQRLCDSLIAYLFKQENEPQKVKKVIEANKKIEALLKKAIPVFEEITDAEETLLSFISDHEEHFEVLPDELSSNAEIRLSREFYFDPRLRDLDMSDISDYDSSSDEEMTSSDQDGTNLEEDDREASVGSETISSTDSVSGSLTESTIENGKENTCLSDERAETSSNTRVEDLKSAVPRESSGNTHLSDERVETSCNTSTRVEDLIMELPRESTEKIETSEHWKQGTPLKERKEASNDCEKTDVETSDTSSKVQKSICVNSGSFSPFRRNHLEDRLIHALTSYLNSHNHVAQSIKNAAAEENGQIIHCLKELESELLISAGPEAVLHEFLTSQNDFEILREPSDIIKFRLLKLAKGELYAGDVLLENLKPTATQKVNETSGKDFVAFRKGVSLPSFMRVEQNHDDKRPKKVSCLDGVLMEEIINYLREHPGQQPLTKITSNKDVDDARKMLSKKLATFGSEFLWRKFLISHRNDFDIRGLDENGSLKNVTMSFNFLSKTSNATCEDPASNTRVSSAILDVPKPETMETTKPTSTKPSSDISAGKETSPLMRKVTENLSVQEIDLVKEILQFLKSHQRANSLDDLQKVKRIQTALGRLQQSLAKFNRTFDWKIFLSLFQRLGVLDVTNLRASSRGVKISWKEGCLQVLSTMCKRNIKDTVSRYKRVRSLNLDDVYMGRKNSQQMLHTTSGKSYGSSETACVLSEFDAEPVDSLSFEDLEDFY